MALYWLSRVRILRFIPFVLLLHCGGPDTQDVGDACGDGNDCQTRSVSACVVRWPQGYCTEVGCTVGSCPTGSRCVTGIDFQDVPFDAFCLKTCEQEAHCRDGYRCVDVSLPQRVCAPGAT